MITSEEPIVVPTSRYNVNQTCELLTISRKTLGKYTSTGMIKCGLRKANMRKFYTGSEILAFWRRSV